MAIVRFRRPINKIIDSIYIENINETKFENCETAYEIEFLSQTVKITNTLLSSGLPNLESVIFNDGNRFVAPNVFVNLKKLKVISIDSLILYISCYNFNNCPAKLITEKARLIGFVPSTMINISRHSKVIYQTFENKKVKKIDKSNEKLEPKYIFRQKNSEQDFNPIPVFDCNKIDHFVPVGGFVPNTSNMYAIYGYVPVINIPTIKPTIVPKFVMNVPNPFKSTFKPTIVPKFVMNVPNPFKSTFKPMNLKLSLDNKDEKKPKQTTTEQKENEKKEVKQVKQAKLVEQTDKTEQINDSSSTTYDDSSSLESSYDETETITFINGKLVKDPEN